jgi:hypothetical protein
MEIKRNSKGIIINDCGVTFNEWSTNLYKQYHKNLQKLGTIPTTKKPNNNKPVTNVENY